MAATLYKSYMRLCEKWTIDPSKKGRDLGEFIRQQVFKEFSQGEASNIKDIKDCERKFQCLNRLVNNYHGKQYKRSIDATTTGLTVDQCKQILSTESLEALKENKLGLFEKIKLAFRR